MVIARNTSMDDLACNDDSGVAPQALDILAGLASLGISQSLREQVQKALSDLTQAAGVVPDPQPLPNPSNTPGRGTAGAGPKAALPAGSARENVLQRKMEDLEQKMNMSRSIMKKLYHKNVELEKELAIARANSSGVDLAPPTAAGTASSRPPTALRPGTSPSYPREAAADSTPISQALQERDLTIRQLQQALEASRRRCSLLELQLASGPGGTPAGTGGGGTAGRGGGGGGGGAGGAGGGKGVSAESLREMLAQSALHHHKYKQIREDYNRLLNKRATALQSGSRSGSVAAVAARSLVGDLQRRLAAEVQEREAEAALYSARLYESEKAISDWYVEKRLLEEHISRLSAEVSERDKIDSEIEGCVTSMLERLRALEAENEELRGRLAVSAGALAD